MILIGEEIIEVIGLMIVDEIFFILLIKNKSLLENKTKKNDSNTIEIIEIFFKILEVANILTLNLGAIKF